jgi:selenium-binding protein 1
MLGQPESLAYVATLNTNKDGRPDAMTVVDVDPKSPSYGKIVGKVNMPKAGDELHHFGWNACSSALCPYAPHPHIERRYLVVPGLRSSRIHIIDTKPDPREPKIVKVIEPEVDRGPQYLAYDFWWHLGYDTMISSEWGTPDTFEEGLKPDVLLSGKYGRRIHIWDLRHRRHQQELDLGPQQQLVFELRAAHDPTNAYGFVNVVASLKDLSSSVWLWHRDNGNWNIRKVIEIPAEPANPDDLPPMLKDFKVVAPFVTDINLSMDDRFLYVSCWGSGEIRQYEVSDPTNPRLTGSVRIGGVVRRAHTRRIPERR